jgi:hypothetical protein
MLHVRLLNLHESWKTIISRQLPSLDLRARPRSIYRRRERTVRDQRNKAGFLSELYLANLPGPFGYGVGFMSKMVFSDGWFKVLSRVESRRVRKLESFSATCDLLYRKRGDFASK